MKASIEAGREGLFLVAGLRITGERHRNYPARLGEPVDGRHHLVTAHVGQADVANEQVGGDSAASTMAACPLELTRGACPTA